MIIASPSPVSMVSKSAHKADIFIKLPMSPALNSAIYFRYDFETESSICLMCGSSIQLLETALQQVYQPTSSEEPRPPQDPFLILASIVSEYVSMMEYERRVLDFNVRDQESKTGMAAHIHDESLRAAAAEYFSLTKDLHVCEGLLLFFERTIEFQVRWIQFLRKQHDTFTLLRFGISEATNLEQQFKIGSQKITASLDLSVSLSRERLEQVKTLSRRIQIQLSVVANLITQNESRTNISIAEESKRIAVETKRDSDSMKTIAALTMVFLPGTFVAPLFSMVFFHVGSDVGSSLSVDRHWWLYLAVTIPLAIVTVGCWLGWLQRKKVRRMQDEENGVSKQTGQ